MRTIFIFPVVLTVAEHEAEKLAETRCLSGRDKILGPLALRVYAKLESPGGGRGVLSNPHPQPGVAGILCDPARTRMVARRFQAKFWNR